MPRAPRFRPALIATALLAVLFGGLATASPAAAHDALVSSSPAEGEQLAAPPAQITLEFSNEVLAMGAEVQVNDTTGRNWVAGEVTITGGTVVAAVDEGMPAGSYEVLWRVVSADGHPISAAIPFSVLQGVTPTPVATPTPTVTAEAVPSPTASPTSAATTDAAASAPAPWVTIVISVAVIALLIAGLLILLARRRRSERADSEA
jgi:methionine-rich copper-binding protein CopC